MSTNLPGPTKGSGGLRLRWRGLAALAGGLLWVAIWLLYLATHGIGESDQQGRLLGLTHYDFGKFLVPALLLIGIGLFSLPKSEDGVLGSLGRVGFTVAIAAMAIMTVAVASLYWPWPLGAYDRD